MEYRGLKADMLKLEGVKNQQPGSSQLVIDENTIYEIDLECQYRKQLQKGKCKSCNEKKGV